MMAPFHLVTETILALLFTAVFVLSVAHSALSLYGWNDTSRNDEIRGPVCGEPPRLGFSLILPARNEAAVIAGTIERIRTLDYPRELRELIVVCERSDVETIAEVERALAGVPATDARLVLFEGGTINKPRALNIGLAESRNAVVGIFDAEDDPQATVLRVAESSLQTCNADAVQLGVQLMDVGSSWYAVHNVLEYFLWYRSRMHFQTRIGAAPLGGNTVFVRRAALSAIGGWDEACLTEDADLGVRLLSAGAKVVAAYDPLVATREETPQTLGDFIRQRTRWNQGFLQVLNKRDWRSLARPHQRLAMAYTLACPVVQAIASLLWLPMLPFSQHGPVWMAMLSWLPSFGLGFQLAVSLTALQEFGQAYGIAIGLRRSAALAGTFLPYQVLLACAAIRAFYRHATRASNWEKTTHVGINRPPVGASNP